MKKQLLTTTALVAAGVLVVSGPALAQKSGKPTLTLGGESTQIFGVGNNDDAYDAINGQRVGFDQHSDGEIFFNGAVTLDNGIKIRTRVELESNTESNTGGETANVAHTLQGDTIDEHWMRISGEFGEVRLGSADAAAQAMTTGYLATWNTNVALNLAFDTGDWVTNPAAVSTSTVGRVDLTSDGELISYFTPRFAGFQAGLSYIPSADEDVNNQRALSGGNADYEGWSMGLNYEGKFSGVGVGVAVGYNTMNESTVGQEDPEVWGGGIRLDFSGIRLSASYVDRDDQKTAGVTTAPGQETIELGAKYTFGPNAVSIAHLRAESTATTGTAGNGDELKSTFISYRRTLGPGVSWQLAAIFAANLSGLKGTAISISKSGHSCPTPR